MGKARSKKTPPLGKRSVGSGSQNQGVCVRNRDYSRRMAKINAAQFIFERGIYLDELKHTSVPEIVVQRGWGDFVKAPGMSNATVVKEFYASMDPDKVKKRGAVLVRDVEVRITPVKINSHFNTLNYDDLSSGFTASNLMKSALAKTLRGTEDDRWDSKHKLKQSQLPHLLAFWNIFLAYSLMPALHRTTLGEDRARLLYCFFAETRIDIGHVIHNAIIDAGRINVRPDAKLRPIIFPSLITALLKKEGVPDLNTDDIRSNTMGDLNLRSWQDIAIKTKGKKRQRTSGGSDDEDDDYEDVSSGSKLDQVLSTVKEIKERTEMLHKRMDLFEAELRHHRDDAADIRKELRLRPYHRRRPASSA
ncbi:hypothetical protein LWI29_024093 [Acer saccharum]|uniref:Putative plant transposon protein domain-containing protein n=1 Tax=Acer saccharum TaxID=4024 RepID=A0AA39SZ70_ACESA|nr:hypothetical protein LWI29_024093 [Acer saccharum]